MSQRNFPTSKMKRAQLLAINLSVTVEPSWLVYHNDGGKELLKGLNNLIEWDKINEMNLIKLNIWKCQKFKNWAFVWLKFFRLGMKIQTYRLITVVAPRNDHIKYHIFVNIQFKYFHSFSKKFKWILSNAIFQTWDKKFIIENLYSNFLNHS